MVRDRSGWYFVLNKYGSAGDRDESFFVPDFTATLYFMIEENYFNIGKGGH